MPRPIAEARRIGAVFALCVLGVARDGWSQPTEAYAEHLMKERDYFRAVGVLKELAFHDANPAEKSRYYFSIGHAYRYSRRYELATETFLALRADPHFDPSVRPRLDLSIGLSLAAQGRYEHARSFLESSRDGEPFRSAIVLGLLALKNGRIDDARALAATARKGVGPVAALAEDLDAATNRVAARPTRSPLAAGIASFVVPGAGQAYTGHWADAAQAFSFVGAFAFATFLSYRYDRDRGGPYVYTGLAAGITVVLHASNVYGAVRTAEFFNQRQREIAEGDIAGRVLAMPIERGFR